MLAEDTLAHMTPREKTASLPPLFSVSPLGQAVMESFGEGIVLFDSYGRLVYANAHAKRAAGIEGEMAAYRAQALRPRLLALGARVAPLPPGTPNAGEAGVLS